MLSRSHLKLVVASFVIAVSLGARAQGTAPSSLAEGLPKISEQIGAHSFVPVQLEKLAHAKVWYVDYDWHRAHGVEVPPEGIRSEAFAKSILDAYAYQSRMADDRPEDFTGEIKEGFADYYGGNGAGTNHGSGRAAAFGLVQSKGVKTSLAKSTDPWHSNGAVQSIEAVDEAIWSQLLDNEFKMGSNKIVAIILTGTYGKMKDGQVFPRALIVREMAVRPAHFMLSPARQFWSTPGDGKADTSRVKESLPGLLDSLPYPKGFHSTDPAERLRAGFTELVNLEALAQAEYVSHRLFFGSYSPSNMEITGRRLDLGDHTSQDGYSPIYRIEHLKSTPFGGTQYFSELFNELRTSLVRTADPAVQKLLPTASETTALFNSKFKTHLATEFVRLTGAPTEILEQLKKTSEGERAIQALGSKLSEASQVGAPAEPVLADPNGWANTSKYDVNALLVALAEARATDFNASSREIAKFVDNEKLRAELAETYSAFVFLLHREARGQISSEALKTYMVEASRRLNRGRPSLVRGHRRWRELWDTTDKAIHENNPSIVQSYIESQVAQNTTTAKDAAPFTVVLSDDQHSAEGFSLRKIFNAKSNSYETVLRLSFANGKAQLNGSTIDLRDLKYGRLRYSTDGGPTALARPAIDGNIATFRFAGASAVDIHKISLERGPLSSVSKGFFSRSSGGAKMTCQDLFEVSLH